MILNTRQATTNDAIALNDLLNAIIDAGGTTAHQTPFDPKRIERHYISPPRLVSCVVAEFDGQIAGFQSLIWPDEDGDPFPDGWAIIASFVDADMTGKGVGRALFTATRAAANAVGVRVIDATIRADNSGGLAYYSALGFVDYDVLPAVPMRDGRQIDRLRKKLDL
ncbi:MAG: GNAT family N-acetyltransferase [Rhodobacteraceae bacterium]|nr:GNAT family N-acetyltransferase [Paracoccaceae bacterium]